ncbi:MAG: family 20 glycosylhydrolase [Bacteroidota bacterium]
MNPLSRINSLLALLLVAGACSRQAPDVRIIPEPAKMTIEPKMVNFPAGRKVYLSSGDSALLSTAEYLCKRLNYSEIGYGSDHLGHCIYLEIKELDFSNNPEAYTLVTGKEGVVIKGNNARGVFYGIQSLLQLLSPEVYGESGLIKNTGIRIPQVSIEDEPRFPWRGMQMDAGRHAYPLEFIRKYIDLLAMHKMNVLYWRPAEDQVDEVRKYADSRFIGLNPEIKMTDRVAVLSPDEYCNLSYYQGDPNIEPRAMFGYLPIEKVYSYEPAPEVLSTEETKQVLGAQGKMKLDYMPDAGLVEYMLAPRISALAEVLWTQRNLRDYEKFAHRMVRQYERFDQMQVNYRVPPPVTTVTNFAFTDSLVLDLHHSVTGGEILYTTDGSDPLSSGIKYSQPLHIKETATVKTITRMKSGHASLPVEIRTERLKLPSK